MQAMYTPEDLTLDPPDPTDRPYCGVSMLTLGIHQLDQHSLIGLDLSLGVTGDWSLAGATQTWIHDAIDAVEPQGWDYQIDNSVLLNLALEHRWRVTTIGQPTEHFGSDLMLGYTGMLGNFRTSLIADASVRVGYRMTSAYGTLSTRPGSEGRLIPPTHTSSWGLHVGFTLAGEAVAYDVTLDGRLFHDDDVQVDREPFIARLGMVFGGHIGNLQLFVLLVESTDAFEGEEKRPSYGRLIATWAF